MGKNINETHEWRRIEDFAEGDSIYAYGTDMLVTQVYVGDRVVTIYYIENDEEKRRIIEKGHDYIARKRG